MFRELSKIFVINDSTDYHKSLSNEINYLESVKNGFKSSVGKSLGYEVLKLLDNLFYDFARSSPI